MINNQIKMRVKQIILNDRNMRIIGIIFFLCSIFILIFYVIKSGFQKSPSNKYLIINTDKSIYNLGELMTIGITSLDKSGQVICNSNLELTITDPNKSTTKITIVNSPTCGKGNATNDSDYIASRILENAGQYKLKLTNLDTKNIVETDIKVDKNPSFEIKRNGATRINPSISNRYPMIITVIANKDYKGQIKEEFPSDLKIVWQGEAKIEGTTLIWNVNLKKGETKTLPYEYATNQTDSKIYLLGPISIGNQKINSLWKVTAVK